MTKMTRKSFLRLAAAAVTTTTLGSRASASAPANSARSPSLHRSNRHLLIRGADLLTMDPLLNELSASDVLIKDGKIAAIGKGLAADGAEIIDAEGMILMPGMCDGDRMGWMILDSGRLVKTELATYASILDWAIRLTACLTPEDLYLGGLVSGLLAIDSGVTSMVDISYGAVNEENAMAAAQGVKDSGIGGWFAFQLGVTASFGPGDTLPAAEARAQKASKATEAHWATAERLQREVFSDSSAVMQLGLAPSRGIGTPIADVADELARARSMGVGLLVRRVHKPSEPIPAGFMGHRGCGIPDLVEAGVLGPDYHLTHANALTDEELGMMRDAGSTICSTIMAEFPYMAYPNRGASAHARARAAGVAVGIGLDVNMSFTQEYFEHARDAYLSHFLSPAGTEIAASYKSEDTLDFVTALGAKSIRLGDVAGSITVGKRADLLLLRTDRMGFGMQGSLADRVLNFASREDIDSVWVGGEAKKRNGEMIGVNWSDLKSQIAKAQARFGPQAESITFT